MKSSIYTVINQIRTFFIPYLFILLPCLIIKLLFSKSQIYFTVNGWHFALGDQFFTWYTHMGDGLTCVAITLILLCFNYRWGFLMGTSYAITSILAQGIKFIFNAPRPIIYFKDEVSRMYLVKGVEMLETHSFPSGHSISAFSMGVILTYITPKKSWGLLFLGVAFLVAYSRVYLSEHFFEDVTVGSAVGVFITIFWLTWIEGKAFIHTKKWNNGLLRKQPA
ncbi:phosphatase PAP2 family protein [Mucilaginibacter sp. AW1-3]